MTHVNMCLIIIIYINELSFHLKKFDLNHLNKLSDTVIILFGAVGEFFAVW